MRTTSKKKTLVTVQMALLIALVVVLQMVSALIPPIGGMVSITLTLIPVVVGGVLFGKGKGAMLGFAFGAIVMVNCIVALDPGGHILWNTNPFFTALICLVKGTAAGFFPAWFYELVRGKEETVSEKRNLVAIVVAALSAPVINTGLFVIGMFVFFLNILSGWAEAWSAGTNIIVYVLVGLAGINFIVEFLINTILSPTIVRITDVVRKKIK